jgi:hypothetical protein
MEKIPRDSNLVTGKIKEIDLNTILKIKEMCRGLCNFLFYVMNL